MDSKEDENQEKHPDSESRDESTRDWEKPEDQEPSAWHKGLSETTTKSDTEAAYTGELELRAAISALEDLLQRQSEGLRRSPNLEEVKSEEAAQDSKGVLESQSEIDDKTNSTEMEVAETVPRELDYEGEEAFIAGNTGIYYLRGIFDHERMNLDDAISNLTSCFEMAVETDHFEYMVKSQVQLASVHIKRYQLHDIEKDYILALEYSENLIQIGKAQELHELWIESLILRAILRKMAKDLREAREDFMEAKRIAKQTEQKQFEFMIETELREVRRLIASATRKKRLGTEDEERMTRDALEKMPAVVNGVLKIDLTRKARVTPVELTRMFIMNLPAGLPLYSYNFGENATDEEYLVFGLLSALSHLATEVTPGAGRMKTLSHEGQTVMMEHRGKYMAALFASKESFRARQSLGRFLKGFLLSFSDTIESGQVITEEQREAATQLLRRTFRFFLPPSE